MIKRENNNNNDRERKKKPSMPKNEINKINNRELLLIGQSYRLWALITAQ